MSLEPSSRVLLLYQVVSPNFYSSISPLQWRLAKNRQPNQEWLVCTFSIQTSSCLPLLLLAKLNLVTIETDNWAGTYAFEFLLGTILSSLPDYFFSSPSPLCQDRLALGCDWIRNPLTARAVSRPGEVFS